MFSTKFVSLEWDGDFVAVNLFSVFKNIYAILQGMLAGLEYKKNTQTFLMIKSLNELIEIYSEVTKKDLSIDTLLTSALLGDFILTGTSQTSRKYTCGFKIATDNNLDYVEKMTVEGFTSLKLLMEKL